jgi:hypothetical protein
VTVKITGIEKPPPPPVAPVWSGTAEEAGKNLQWFYWPSNWLHIREQDDINPRCWMNVDPPAGARRAVLKAVREIRGSPQHRPR